MSTRGGTRVAATPTDAHASLYPVSSAAYNPSIPRVSARKPMNATMMDTSIRRPLFAQTVPSRNLYASAGPRLPSLPPVSQGPRHSGDLRMRPLGQSAAEPPYATSSPSMAGGAWVSQTVPVMARAELPLQLSAGSPNRGARASNPTSSSLSTGTKTNGSQNGGNKKGKKSATAFLRSCHRLQNPNDAFRLNGPVKDVDPHKAAGKDKKKRDGKTQERPPLSEEEKKVRRERIVRSFLPETLEAKRVQKQSEKDARRARRQRHERKKKHMVEKEVQRARRRVDAEDGVGDQNGEASALSAHERSAPSSSAAFGHSTSLSSSCNASLSSVYSSLSSSTLPPSLSASASSADLFLDDNQSDMTEPYEETVAEKRERFEQEMLLFFDAMHARRVAAACLLQRAYRCHQARRALHDRQQLVYGRLYAHQKAAALCIVGFLQSVVQTHRREARLCLRATRNEARAARERQQRDAVGVIERAVYRWRARMQERARRVQILGLQWDSRLGDFDRATVLVQRWWRLVKVQKAYWRRRTREVEEAQRQQAVQQRLDAAATSIQRIVRGHQARTACRARAAAEERAATELRKRQDAAANVLTNFLREYAVREEARLREYLQHAARAEAAAATIQHSWRDALRKRVLATAACQARVMHAAATVVQRTWRKFKAAHELRYLRQLQQTVKVDRCREEVRRYDATLVVQCFARRVLAKAEVRRQKAAAGRSVLWAFSLLQRIGRGYLGRTRLGHTHTACRRAREEAAAAAALYDSWSRSVLHAFLAAKRSFADSQKRARARAAEKRLIAEYVAKELREEAEAAQASAAARAAREAEAAQAEAEALERAKQYVNACALSIQLAWRGYRARQRLHVQRQYQVRWQAKREDLEQVAWLLYVDNEAALWRAEQTHRATLVTEETEESACIHWWARHEQRRCRGLIGADDNEDDEPPPAAMAAVYARAMLAQSEAKDAEWSALYE